MAESHQVKFKDPADLIAGIPHLLGFHPEKSLVLVLKSDRRVRVVVRADLPVAGNNEALAAQLMHLVRTSGATAVDVIVIDDGHRAGAPPPYRDLITVLVDAMDAMPVNALWAQATTCGAHWGCYAECACLGLVSDPQASELAALNAAMGNVTFARRDALAATLHPQSDAATVDRRTSLARDLLRAAAHRANPGRSADTVNEAVGDACAGTLPTEDMQIVDLAVALADPRIRDRCCTHLGTPQAPGALELWTVLAREAPPGLRANPASLVAIFAYATGEGALAQVALDAALKDDRENKLASLVRQAIDMGISPQEVVAMLRRTCEGA